MQKKTILITGSTDGIGKATAELLADAGHTILLHGRSDTRLAATVKALEQGGNPKVLQTCRADLSRISEVEQLAETISARHSQLDVLINNAGVYNTPYPITPDGLDARFAVNTIAPYILTRRLLPLMRYESRVVNVASAALAPVSLEALAGEVELIDSQAYAQSKLALTMWSMQMADTLAESGPTIITVNPGSYLGSKMVRDAYGIDGLDLRVGADILARAALSAEFADASGRFYDNDQSRFVSPHPDAMDAQKTQALVQAIEDILADVDR